MNDARENENEKIVPPQQTGNYSGAESCVEKENLTEAKELFRIARERLMNVNRWHEYSGTGSGSFQLTDEKGNSLSRKPKVGDLLKINLPGPGPRKGKGYDWVRIEAMDDEKDEAKDEELFAFRARPVTEPGSENEDSAHFFKNAATSSFIVKRTGKKITASEIGRNEHPNTDTEKVFDKVRNAIFATAASYGVAHMQWKKLMDGILSEK